ncbi:hydrogenase accessory protein [Rhodoblastus acidophilus]|uniref:Hydrogenase expression/formation protein n=1 Tax=Candidatus Rhodoblastus alkanivorans TaxID=2954117 RepID=A0ABS9Z2G9_9HYPH|nr:hydrogenase accessory protein [Candidatus Rhodoblastus alkanivorans]MCI4677448.1 hydrogenase accessory protein [Candidatus Rhodoblastus alkanivorans]MCI4681807.1 hydrogenase accessory protein [Candidatus Rhodoblastus alkanivorans]MDI4642857.1 hydrogenase accessory protein [Rhodoblastus acidophilus]
MDHPVLNALVARAGLLLVDESNIDAFLAPAAGECSNALLFFSGAAAPRPESSDVATILPEILRAFEGRLRGAIVAPEAEASLKTRFQVFVAPSLCVTRGAAPVAVLPKILDWADYLERIEAALDPQAPVLTAAAGPKTVFTFSQGADR